MEDIPGIWRSLSSRVDVVENVLACLAERYSCKAMGGCAVMESGSTTSNDSANFLFYKHTMGASRMER